MTVVVDDPLIARMAITRTLPLHESSRRLRELYPECPRVYGVAVMGDLSRRRWWPLAEIADHRPPADDVRAAAAETDNRVAVAQQLAATLAHVVIGRVVPLLVLEGRAWDTGLENLWVHVDSEGAIDWVGVVDPTLRALPDDPYFGGRRMRAGPPAGPDRRAAQRGRADDVGGPPQPPRARAAVRQARRRSAAARCRSAAMWHVVGAAVVSAATQVPLLAGSSELTSMRRGQAVLDALVGLRRSGPRRPPGRSPGKALLN